jgi:hypothetical protein
MACKQCQLIIDFAAPWPITPEAAGSGPVALPQDRERAAITGENDSIVASGEDDIHSSTIADELTAAIREHKGFRDGNLT